MAEKEYPFQQKITVLGGGTGQFNVLRGLIEYTQPENITAIPGTWDSGGSSGKLRTDLGVLPPGDARRCLIALMEDDEQREIAIQLFDDRLEGFKSTLQGHSIGNLIIAGLERAHQGHDKGLDATRKLFRIRGNITPIRLNNLRLIAKTQSGIEIEGEESIDHRWQRADFNPDDPISSIYFTTKPQANPKALDAILNSDKIILSMGSLYGSILPHLLIPGVQECIIKSKAKLITILNIMTERGQTDSYKNASDHLKPLLRYLKDADRLDYLIVNENSLNPEIIEIYRQEGQKPVVVDREECSKLASKLQIVSKPLGSYDSTSHLLRHDPEKLAQTILELDC